MAKPVAILDACVLYPAPLRDLLMQLAFDGHFMARWTNRIHSEWMDNLLANRPDLSYQQLERTCDLLNAHSHDCLVTDYQAIESTLHLPDSNDCHVLAAAIKTSATKIITYNLKDFPADYLHA